MSFEYDPRQFLEIAEDLLQDRRKGHNKEGRIRTAIGRAYYAAFLITKKKLQEIGYSFRRVERLHKDVIYRLMKDKHFFIGSKLNTLFDNRVDADYKMNAKITSKLGQSSIELAQDILRAIDKI